MFALVERETGKVIETYDYDFNDFLENKWGGLFPFMTKDGCMHCGYGRLFGCHRYDYYWKEL